MLDSIEEVHDRGFIHRDVKAVIFLFFIFHSPILFYPKITNMSTLWTLG